MKIHRFVPKIKLKKASLNSNFVRYDLENNHSIDFDINNELEIIKAKTPFLLVLIVKVTYGIIR